MEITNEGKKTLLKALNLLIGEEGDSIDRTELISKIENAVLLNQEVRLHLKDILRDCEGGGDIEQIEHNVSEIAEHLDINMDEVKE